MSEERLRALEEERKETIKLLRDLCAQYGDNNWPDELHLADIIEKHLVKPMLEDDREGSGDA